MGRNIQRFPVLVCHLRSLTELRWMVAHGSVRHDPSWSVSLVPVSASRLSVSISIAIAIDAYAVLGVQLKTTTRMLARLLRSMDLPVLYLSLQIRYKRSKFPIDILSWNRLRVLWKQQQLLGSFLSMRSRTRACLRDDARSAGADRIRRSARLSLARTWTQWQNNASTHTHIV